MLARLGTRAGTPEVTAARRMSPTGFAWQKVLAQAGVASRRGAEELIAAGRISVDGEIVVEQGLRINPDTAIVQVDGARVIIDGPNSIWH